MSADTAKLLASLDLQDAMSPKLKTAMGNVSAAEGRVGSLSGGLAKLGSTLRGGVGGALTTFTGRIRQFGLGLAAAAGIGGLLTFGGAIKSALSRAQDFGNEVARMTALTGLAAPVVSSLAAALEHYGVSADTAIRLTGMAEKNLFILGGTAKKAATFQKAYGLSLLDSKGKLVDVNEELLRAADYFNNKNIPAQTKAAALAKLYGRTWQELIPILSAGRAGIAGAEEEAQKLGLTLSGENVAALTKLREATRSWGTALGGLELQIGLALVPTLTDLARAATAFVSSHRTDIVSFFKNAVQAAKNVARTIGDLAGTIGAFWSSIPEGVRDLLVKGFVADRTVKFLFGFDPIKALLGGAGGLFSRGSSPANPLYVTGIGGLPGGGGPGGGLPLLGLGGLILAGVAAAEVGIAEWLRQQLHPTTSGDLYQNYTPSEAADYHSGRKSVEDIMSDRAAITAGFAGANAREDRTNFELQAVKARLTAIHNAIKASIGKLNERLKHPLLPHSIVNHQLHAALRIAKSSESTDRKIKDLEAIDKDLRAGGHKTAHYVEDLIAVEKAKKTKFTANFRTTVNVNGHTVYRIASTNTSVPILASRAGTDL